MGCVRRTVTLPVPRDRAWRSITEPGWLADDRERTIEERIEERRLTWRWGDGGDESLVELTLDDDPEGTRLTVLEIRTADLPEVPAVVPAGMRALALA